MEQQTTPRSIGIIMDGNRRWAKMKGLPLVEGHRRGYEKLREVLGWARKRAITNVTVYAFSTENWNRAKEEVGYLMSLFRGAIGGMIEEAKKNHTRIIFLGERTQVPPDITALMSKGEQETKDGAKFTVGIALSYGGRSEILDAIRRIPKEKIADISEKDLSALLWTKEIPDPDLILRTSGEHRLSGFLPWQGVYSELFFLETLWPDFTEEEFDRMLEEYGKRQRRFGS